MIGVVNDIPLLAKILLNKITILKGNGEYDQAITLSKKLVGSVKATKENYLKAAELIGQAEAKINDAKSYDAYTSEAEKLYDEAATKMEEDEYETAIAVALESIEAAENVKNAQITHLQTRASKKISGLTNDISAAEKIGADTGKPISILNQIRSALENLEFNSTFNNIELCKNAVSESKNKHQNALDNLNSTKATIAESKKFGADINKAEQIISKAEEALKNFDYGIVETQITLAKDEAERARERRRQYLGLKEQTEDIIKTSRATMGELKDNGIIAQSAEGLLSSAETSFSNSEFQQAQEHANNAIRTCKDVQKVFTEASASQQKAQTSISNSKILIDTTEARQLYEQCRLKMDEGNYSEALTLAIESMENIEAIKTNNVPKVTIKSQEIPTFKSGSWAKWEL